MAFQWKKFKSLRDITIGLLAQFRVRLINLRFSLDKRVGVVILRAVVAYLGTALVRMHLVNNLIHLICTLPAIILVYPITEVKAAI